MKKICRQLTTVVVVLALIFSAVFFDLNLLGNEVRAASTASCTGTSSYHTVPSSITNLTGPMPDSCTQGYIVGQTREWMCVSPRKGGPTGTTGNVEVRTDTTRFVSNRDSLDPFEERNLSVGQVVYGCYESRNNNWALAHAILSYVITGDSSWLDSLTSNADMQQVVHRFARNAASIGSTVPANIRFYVYIPSNSAYQMLINIEFTPDQIYSSVEILKRDSQTQEGLAGATIRFTCDQGASGMEDVRANTNTTALSDGTGFTFVSPTNIVRIEKLKPNCTYRIQELVAPEGYEKTDHVYVVAVSKDGVVTIDGVQTATAQIVIDNTPNGIPQELKFYKFDQNDSVVAGARIQLRPQDGSTIPEDVAWTGAASNIHRTAEGYIEFTTANCSTSEPQIVISGLPENGQYYFHEAQQPNGYAPSLDINTGSSGSVTMVDNKLNRWPYYQPDTFENDG